MKTVHKIKLTYKTITKDKDKASPNKVRRAPSLGSPPKKKYEYKATLSKTGRRIGRPPKQEGVSPVKKETRKTEKASGDTLLDMPPPSRILPHECKYSDQQRFCGVEKHVPK